MTIDPSISKYRLWVLSLCYTMIFIIITVTLLVLVSKMNLSGYETYETTDFVKGVKTKTTYRSGNIFVAIMCFILALAASYGIYFFAKSSIAVLSLTNEEVADLVKKHLNDEDTRKLALGVPLFVIPGLIFYFVSGATAYPPAILGLSFKVMIPEVFPSLLHSLTNSFWITKLITRLVFLMEVFIILGITSYSAFAYRTYRSKKHGDAES